MLNALRAVSLKPEHRVTFPGEIQVVTGSRWKRDDPEGTTKITDVEILLQHFSEDTRDKLGWRAEGDNRAVVGSWVIKFTNGEPYILSFDVDKFGLDTLINDSELVTLVGSDQLAAELITLMSDQVRTFSRANHRREPWYWFASMDDFYVMMTSVGEHLPATASESFVRQKFLDEHRDFWLETESDVDVPRQLAYYASHGPKDGQTQAEYEQEVEYFKKLVDAGRSWARSMTATV